MLGPIGGRCVDEVLCPRLHIACGCCCDSRTRLKERLVFIDMQDRDDLQRLLDGLNDGARVHRANQCIRATRIAELTAEIAVFNKVERMRAAGLPLSAASL